MSTGLPLAELTALLAQQLAESAAVSERRQRDEYVALAAEAEGTVEAYLERTIGCTEKERHEAATRYLEQVVAPLLPRTRRVVKPVEESMVRCDRAGLERLVAHFGETIRDGMEPGASAGTWIIGRERIEQVILEKLRKEAEARYRHTRLLLRTGVPHTQIRGAKLSAKVLLQEDGRGSVTARLATEESAKESAEAISTLTVDFSVGAFPSFE